MSTNGNGKPDVIWQEEAKKAQAYLRGLNVAKKLGSVFINDLMAQYPNGVPHSVYVELGEQKKEKKADKDEDGPPQKRRRDESIESSWSCFYTKLNTSYKSLSELETIKISIEQEAPWSGSLIDEIKKTDWSKKDQFDPIIARVRSRIKRCQETIQNLQWVKNWEEICMYGMVCEIHEKSKKSIRQVALTLGLNTAITQRRVRIYKLWRTYKNLAMTAVPLHVWDMWIGEMEKFLQHPDNLDDALKWAGNGLTVLPITDVLWEIFNADQVIKSNLDLIYLGEDEQMDEEHQDRDRDGSSGSSNNTTTTTTTNQANWAAGRRGE